MIITFLRQIRGFNFCCLLFTAIAAIGQAAGSELPVEWSHPLPQGNTLRNVVYGDGTFVTVGDASTILWSENGEDWTAAEAPVFDYIHQVIHNDDAFLAVGTDHILRSFNGKEWEVLFDDSASSRRLRGITVRDDGRIMVGSWRTDISGQRDITILTSPSADGEWQSQMIADVEGMSLALAHGDGTLIALISTDSNQAEIVWSSDGLTWTPASIPSMPALYSAVFAWGKFWAVGAEGELWASTDGDLWSHAETLSERGLNQLTFDGERLTAFGRGEVPGTTVELISNDGLSWNEVIHNTTEEYAAFAYSSDRHVSVGAGGAIGTSTDPEEWTAISNRIASDSLSDVSYGHGRYVAVGGHPPELERLHNWYPEKTGGVRSILVSEDAEQWEPVTTSPEAEPLYAVAFANDTFVAVGRNGAIETSPDGLSWTAQSAPIHAHLFDVIHDGDRFIAAGAHGTILESADGLAWNEVQADAWEPISSLAWNGSLYIATTSSGDVATSTTLIHWNWSTLKDEISLYAAAFNNGRFVAVGGVREDWAMDTSVKGRIFSSLDGQAWTPVTGDFSTHFRDVIPYQDGFLAVAGSPWEGGRVFTSPDGLEWTSTNDQAIAPPLWGIALLNGHVIVAGDDASILKLGEAGAIPAILQQPRGLPVLPGDSVTLSVVAEGGTGPLEYQWFRDGEELSDHDRLSGADSATLEIADLVTEDTGKYQARVTSGNHSLMSEDAILSVVSYLSVRSYFHSLPPEFGTTIFDSIQDAIDAVDPEPMVVRVEEGAYHEKIRFKGKPVILTRADTENPGQYEIMGDGTGGPLVKFVDQEDSRTVLRGFTLYRAGMHGSSASAILIDGSSPIIEDNHIEGNTAQGVGGGIRIENASPAEEKALLRRNHILRNTAEYGAGIAVLNASARIENNIIAENGIFELPIAGGGIYISSPAEHHVAIINNTIAANRASQGGGIQIEGEATVEIVNSIIAFQESGGGISRHPERVEPVAVRYSNVWRNTDGDWINLPDRTGHEGNLTLRPFFLQTYSLESYRLESEVGVWHGFGWFSTNGHSPLIAAGDPSSDFSRESMPNGGRINMGAYGNTETASRAFDLPLVSTMMVNGVPYLIRTGDLSSPLKIELESSGNAVLNEHFETIPHPVIIPEGETLLPLRLRAIPGEISDGELSASLSAKEDPAYIRGHAYLTLSVPTLPYNEWLREEIAPDLHSSPRHTEPHEDPDGRGIPNLLRYAFAMGASGDERTHLPRTEVRQIETENTSQPHLCLTYVRRPSSSGLIYILEGSSDLQTWHVIDEPRILETTPIDDAEIVTVRDENPLPDSASFLRLRVEFDENPDLP